MSNLEEIILIPIRVLELFSGGKTGTFQSSGGSPPSTKALTTTTTAQKTAVASGSTGSGAGGTPMPASATQKAYVTHMPTTAPKPVTRRPAGVRYK